MRCGDALESGVARGTGCSREARARTLSTEANPPAALCEGAGQHGRSVGAAEGRVECKAGEGTELRGRRRVCARQEPRGQDVERCGRGGGPPSSARGCRAGCHKWY